MKLEQVALLTHIIPAYNELLVFSEECRDVEMPKRCRKGTRMTGDETCWTIHSKVKPQHLKTE